MIERGHHDEADLHEHDRGLSHDLPTLVSRRRLLSFFGGAGLAALTGGAMAGCGDGSAADDTAAPAGSATAGGAGTPGTGTPGTGTSGSAAAAGTKIPQETAGPFPGDGSNGVNILNRSGVVRSDITGSFATASAVARGVPLRMVLTVLDTANGSAPLAGAAVYVWQCDREGRYSMYSPGVEAENYLRGVQETDAAGRVTFASIYPGAYPGRWPHIHFEVYPSLAKAGTASDRLRTSQLALPEDASRLVYATEGYGASPANLARTSLSRDMVFRDGYSLQMATVTGTTTAGMTATLNVPV
ncbi:MAG TPA: 3,4-dioxygenase subunit beta [Micromonosporaceae bacterium]|nr:3,4-dioxygenase subunit beta [Micromonosporaceae bacterium]